ncbi:MAG: TonB-dependent receptor [Pseudomonadota bacterium]
MTADTEYFPRTRALRGTLGLVSVLAFACSALSTATAQEPEREELEEITVVGSHIQRDGFAYSAPVAIINNDTLEATGTTNLGDLLQTLPQNVSSNNNATSGFTLSSAGLNLTDLRNLGSSRTLVLINGRRFVSGVNPGVGYGVDLNALPVSMIERIEVLTGGASAVYGSDAVAGVVNVVTRTDFEGVDLEVQTGASTQGDKRKDDVYLTLGGKLGDSGNAWLSLGWSDDSELFTRDRPWSATDIVVYDLDGDGLGETDEWLGSSFVPQGRFGTYLGTGEPFRNGLADRENSDLFNRADFRTIFTPVERRFANGAATFQASDRLTVSAELNYSLVEALTQTEPFALDINDNIFIQSRGGTGGIDVATHPLIPDLLRTNLLNDGITDINQLGIASAVRRLVEFGPRRTEISRTTLRGVVAFDYELPSDWVLSGYYTYGRTDQDQQGSGQINTERAALALDIETGPDGQLRCRDEIARLQGCVPFNPFGAGTITSEQVQYLAAPSNFQAIVEQEVFNLGLNGSLPLELPGGAVAVAGGLEYREERGAEIPGGFLQAGVSGGNVSRPTDGKFDVFDAYAEVYLPLHERFGMDLAVRAGDYSTVGSQTTWKAGIDATIVESLRFRGTVATAVRAPNIADLFSGDGETFQPLTDPCNGIDATTAGNVAENCRSIPVIADRIADTGSFTLSQVEIQQTGGFISGNPEVAEETADSITAGLVWQPGFLGNFSVSADWYNIEIDDGIAITSRTVVLQRCFDVAPGEFDPTCGGQARRDGNAGAGGLVGVDSNSSNENRFETQGIDIELAYSRPLGAGDISWTMFYNHLLKFDTIGIVDGDLDEDAGEVLFPENRLTGNLRYDWGNWAANYRVRFWDSVKDSNTPELTNENFSLGGVPVGPEKNEISAYTYHDVSLAYVNDNWRVTAGINNALDKDPPLLTQFSQYGNTGTNTAAEAYDPVGRTWYFNLGYTFD